MDPKDKITMCIIIAKKVIIEKWLLELFADNKKNILLAILSQNH